MDEDTRFLWWDLADDDMQQMLAMIVNVGAQRLRLELHRKHEDGPKRFLLVDKQTGEPCGSYNVSHTCPPDCP